IGVGCKSMHSAPNMLPEKSKSVYIRHCHGKYGRIGPVRWGEATQQPTSKPFQEERKWMKRLF
ncbi:MAG: hypothetical protein IIT75_00190, partial [Candidatus Methanomethylophilus sp.]|nr:hypothetical protein [Methanomethylophilus sp.]